MPSTDFSYSFSDNKPTLFEFLNQPLVKCEENEDEGVVIGYKSGKRSAIIETDKDCYVRLKGCGN